MSKPEAHATLTDYNAAARVYDRQREPSEHTARLLSAALSSADPGLPLLSIGCGTGQIEQLLKVPNTVVGVDRSSEMLSIARSRLSEVHEGDMTALPFGDRSFGGAYFVQSFHHCGKNLSMTEADRASVRRLALREAVRVVVPGGPIALVFCSTRQLLGLWYYRYFPEARERMLELHPCVSDVAAWLTELGCTGAQVSPARDALNPRLFDPEAPLDPDFRGSLSDFSLMDETELRRGLARLRAALDDGSAQQAVAKARAWFDALGGEVIVMCTQTPPEG